MDADDTGLRPYLKCLVAIASIAHLGAPVNGQPMKVALGHDWLDTWRGGESVLAEFCRMYPEADLYAPVDFLGPARVTASCSTRIGEWASRRFSSGRYAARIAFAVEKSPDFSAASIRVLQGIDIHEIKVRSIDRMDYFRQKPTY